MAHGRSFFSVLRHAPTLFPSGAPRLTSPCPASIQSRLLCYLPALPEPAPPPRPRPSFLLCLTSGPRLPVLSVWPGDEAASPSLRTH